jgi:hypothetical protein
MEGDRWCVLVMLWVWAWATEAIIAATDRDGGAISECAAQTYGHSHGHTYARTHTHNYTESTITEEIALNKTLSSQEQVRKGLAPPTQPPNHLPNQPPFPFAAQPPNSPLVHSLTIRQIVLIAAAIPTAYPKYRLGDKVKLSKQRDL